MKRVGVAGGEDPVHVDSPFPNVRSRRRPPRARRRHLRLRFGNHVQVGERGERQHPFVTQR